MNTIIITSFIPEIFFSCSVLLQLVLNARLMNNIKLRYPVITQEVYIQTLFILSVLALLYCKSQIDISSLILDFTNNNGIFALKFILIILSLCIIIIIKPALSFQKINNPEYFSIYLISIFSLLLMISAESLISFYLVMEMQALCFYILASMNRKSIFSAEAGLKYFISGSVISGFYLLGVSFIYGVLGSVDLITLKMHLNDFLFEGSVDIFYYILLIGFLLIICTLLFKLACAPFHFWAPDVYDGAPISSTVIFSILPKISLIVFFFKILIVFQIYSGVIASFLLFFGILSTFIGTFYALKQKRVKKLIIYSSIAQTGFLVSGLSLFTLDSKVAVLFFLFVYLLTSLIMWQHVIRFYYSSSCVSEFNNLTKTSLYVTDFSNLLKVNKFYSISLLLVFFSIAGIPYFIGFLSKMTILSQLVETKNITAGILLIVLSAVSVYYYIRMIKISFFESNKVVKTNPAFVSFATENNKLQDILVSVALLLLIVLFFFPTVLVLVCHYLTLSLHLM